MLEPAGNYAGDILVSEPFWDKHLKDKDVLGREIIYFLLQDSSLVKVFPSNAKFYDPMKEFMTDGKHRYEEFACLRHTRKRRVDIDILKSSRERFFASFARLDYTHKRIIAPRAYGVGLEKTLHDLRNDMIIENACHNDRFRQQERFS